MQRASVGLKLEPAGQRKVYSWNVESDACRQYLYDWQSDSSGFGKRPDEEHTKVGSKVVGSSSVVVGVVDGSGVVVMGSAVVTGSVEDSVVDDGTLFGQV